MNMAFNLFGNYVGVSKSNTTGVYDVVEAEGQHQKILYYPSKRDEAIVWDSALLDADPKRDVNLLIFEVSLPSEVPIQKGEDVLVNVQITR